MVDSSKTAKLQLKMRPRSPIIMSGRSKIGICESSLKSVNKLDKNTKYSVLPDESPIVHMQNRPKQFKYSNLQSTPYAQNIKKSITESREIINLSPIAATSTTVIDNPVNGTDIFPCHLLKCKREIPMDCSIDPNTSKINNSKEIKSKLKFSTHLKAQSPESNLCEPLMISEIANKKSLKHKNENTKRCLFENEKLSSSNSDMDQDSLNISLDTLEQVCQMSERTLECSNKNVNNLVSFLYGNTSTKLENTVVENDLLRLALKMEDFITNEKKPKKVLEVETNFTTLNKLQKNENTSFQNSKKCKNDNVHSIFFTNSTQLTTNNLMSTNEIGNTQMCEIADIIEPLSSFDDQWTQQYTLNSNIQVSSSSNCNQGAVHNLKLKCDVQSSNNEHKYSYTYKSENKMYKPLTENTEFSTPENNSLNILKRATHKSEVLVKDDKTSLSNEKLKPLNIPQATTNEFKGFSTATGKAIEVPEQALSQAEALLKDDQAQSLNVKLKTLSRVDEASNKFKGFSTATGKSIKISAKALHKVETLLNDDETQLLNKRVNPLNIPQATTNEFKGFSTATGKAIEVPEQALSQAEALLKDDQAQSLNVKLKTLSRVDEASNKFKGFSTATGKSIKISAKALHKVETLLNDDETQLLNKRVNPLNIPQATTNEFKGFSTATGKAIEVPEQALSQAEALLKDDQAQSLNVKLKTLSRVDEASNKFKGFSTATGKSIKISAKALHKVETLLNDDETQLLNKRVNPLNIPQATTNEFKGFSTATGKAIKVPEQALRQAEALLKDDQAQSSNVKLKTLSRVDEASNKFKGFSTATGKSIKISAKALHKVETLLNDDETQLLNKRVNPLNIPQATTNEFKGFSTATGKAIKVPEQALRQVEALLKDDQAQSLNVKLKTLSRVDEASNKFKGFSTATGKSIKISAKALHKVETLLNDDETQLLNKRVNPLNIPQATTNEFKGFSTATGKAIKVPEQALRQVEALLKDDQAQSTNGSFNILVKADEPSNKLKSFSTDKSVMISENTTQMAQIVFKDGNCVVNKLSSYNDNLLKIDNKKKILQSVSKCNIGKSDILGNIEDMNVEIIDEFFSNDSFILSENKLLGTGNKPAFKELQNLKNTTHNSTHDKKSLNDGLNDTQSILEDISLVDTVERIEKGQQHFLNTTSHNKRPGSPNYDIEKIIKKPILDFGWEKNELEKSFKVYLSKKLSSQKTSLSTLVDYSLPKKSTANQHFNGNYDFANFDSNKSLDFKLCWDYNRSNTEANFYNFNNIKNLFESHFLVDVKLIPKSWVENHFHWIIWKLASMELSFPNLFANKLLTAKNTIHELLYRYYREIEKCQRSVLKKILEKDDVATKRMILCVSKIIKSNTAENYNIELTDGWYKVQGLLDSEMNTLVHRQVVRVGTKLLISNAELVGAGEGIDPLQVHDGVKLKISTNSTRRVRWYAKLGLCKYPTSPVPISLESVLPHGGTIGSLSLVVLRKYPMLYFERKLNSKSVFRNEKMEIFEEEKHKTTQQKNLEKISNNIQSEMERELMSKTKNKIKLIKITKENIKNYSIEELSDIIENCMDPSEIQSVISEDKLEAIQNYKKTQHDNFMYELKKRVDNVFNDQFKDNKRRVTPLLKLRVVDEKDACSGLNFAVLTIWNPSESVSMFFDTISEGHCCVFSHLTATGYMNGELQLSAGKQSHYVFKKIINNYAKRAVISAKTFWSGSFSPLYSELDLVGIVIGIIKENETFNEVYVTDTEMNIVSIVFRGDFKEFGCDDKMLYPGSIISGMNLVFKGFHSNTPIPKVYVTELSLFTTVPKAEHLKQCSDDYIKFLKNSENFIQLCQNKIVEFQNKKSDVPSHDIDVYSLNVANKKIQKPYGESPSAAVSSPHVFQSEFSPVRKRLKMLNAYGKTPPLNIIHTKPPNKKLMNQFKTPNRM